jgi:phosphatidate cytidylyltransferase
VASRDPAFKLRVVSALVLAPLALGLVAVGGWAFALLMALMLVLMAVEWRALTEARSSRREAGLAGGIALVVGLVAVLLAATGRPDAALIVLLAGAPVAAVLTWRFGVPPLWAGFGVLYLGVPLVALIWLRAVADVGLMLLIWLLIVVWTTDTAAYFVGRHLGGPKLAPRISPSKTWSGLCGGVLGAGLVGMVAAVLAGCERPWQAGWVGAALAMVAQAGDLAESSLKRRAGVKDSGTLIPGHGGLLDRVDGLLFAAPALAVVVLLLEVRACPWP